ncbi:PDR/VanB family oxidoreductase [Mesorhizobium sp. YIM 152430]|uniref:PDR/VanB family oxidoreductase n=1 Tax=Mesorhizobium sp. YIM 152430 TaxID=3031761 RepID=UPI0023DC0079|nr:PDR/VanB family oxidoreductase [Mesorhizobium sp. YIM 152430]MDF1598686.1 PDR/VanB family oxidoreductase [Mesorhizobium sp. YIM 152430]
MSQLRLKVSSVEAPTDRIRALTLASEDGRKLPGYRAGAHIRIALPHGGERHYSLINPDAGSDTSSGVRTYRLGVLMEPESKGGSRYMHGLKPGDTIATSAPKNEFGLVAHEGPAILLAGGIGVTPIISMAAELKRAGRPFEFHYSGRSRPLMAFVDEIEETFGDALNIYCDDEAERCLDLSGLIERAPADAHFYVCGPRGMIEAVRDRALPEGFSKDRVHFELFDRPEEQSGDQPFEVEVKSTGEVFTIPPGRTIIEVLEEGGVDLVYDCQRGDCGICQTSVLEGVPDHRDVILTEDERAANDVMQICVSRAKSARLVLDL